MDVRSAITQSGEYKSFRATVPKRRIDLEYKRKEYTFKIYDYGPKSVTSPIIFFPPVSGTADVFFRQIVSLTTEGFRCIAVYLNFCLGFMICAFVCTVVFFVHSLFLIYLKLHLF